MANAPGVMRLYPMDGEVKAGLKKATSNEQEHAKEFDRQTAEDGLRYADDLGINAHFMAVYALTTIAIDDASIAYRHAKRRNIAMSQETSFRSPKAYQHLLRFKGTKPVDLLAAIPALGNVVGGSGPKVLAERFKNMLEPFKKNTDQYPALNELVEKAIAGEELDDSDRSYMKSCPKDVYADFLRTFDGTVVTMVHSDYPPLEGEDSHQEPPTQRGIDESQEANSSAQMDVDGGQAGHRGADGDIPLDSALY
ncbi:hypothetical protein LRP88_10068 [Fusarium phalaenopsidis]